MFGVSSLGKRKETVKAFTTKHQLSVKISSEKYTHGNCNSFPIARSLPMVLGVQQLSDPMPMTMIIFFCVIFKDNRLRCLSK